MDADYDLDQILADCRPEDFDGHTEFSQLNPEQRLEWLSQIMLFVHECKGMAARARVY